MATDEARESLTTGKLVEIGHSGLRRVSGLGRSSGTVREGVDPLLTGKVWRDTLRRMWDTDPIVGAVITAIKLMVRQVAWEVTPAGPKRADLQQAEFLESCLADMSTTWPDTVDEILSMLVFGWAYLEIVYKYRQGPNPRVRQGRPRPAPSQYEDGRLGWRKFALRPQDTLSAWLFDSAGGTQGMVQAQESGSSTVTIPIQKALLFRPETFKKNPEGRSILTNAYRPWYIKRNIEQLEAMGIERDLVGLPVIEMPLRMMQEDSSETDKAVVDQMLALLGSIKRDENEGVIIPRAFDQYNNKLFEFRLLSADGTRQYDVDKVIARYDQRIAMVALADFILLGHEKVGSFSLASAKSSFFTAALETWVSVITTVMNTYAIPRLMRYNGWPRGPYATIGHRRIQEVNLHVLGEFIQRLTSSGMVLFPSRTIEDHVLRAAGLPVPPDDDRPDYPVTAPPPGDQPGRLKQPEPADQQKPTPNDGGDGIEPGTQ